MRSNVNKSAQNEWNRSEQKKEWSSSKSWKCMVLSSILFVKYSVDSPKLALSKTVKYTVHRNFEKFWNCFESSIREKMLRVKSLITFGTITFCHALLLNDPNGRILLPRSSAITGCLKFIDRNYHLDSVIVWAAPKRESPKTLTRRKSTIVNSWILDHGRPQGRTLCQWLSHVQIMNHSIARIVGYKSHKNLESLKAFLACDYAKSEIKNRKWAQVAMDYVPKRLEPSLALKEAASNKFFTMCS